MALTLAQRTILKADIAADPVLSTYPHNSDGAFAIAAAYGQVASPDFWVWRSVVSIAEIMGNGFDWVRVDNLSVGKARIWEWMTDLGAMNPSQANVRAGIEACWSVEAGDQGMRQAIYNHSAARATRGQKLFAVGAGTAPTHHGIGPGTTTLESPVTYQDVLTAWAD